MEILLVVWILWSCAGTLLACAFLFYWGWSDASWGDPRIHTGHTDDEWHKTRRPWFYLVAFWACAMNPAALIFFALGGGRKCFRAGVRKYDPETYKRWYGG